MRCWTLLSGTHKLLEVHTLYLTSHSHGSPPIQTGFAYLVSDSNKVLFMRRQLNELGSLVFGSSSHPDRLQWCWDGSEGEGDGQVTAVHSSGWTTTSHF